ncbi:MAG: M1 family metallopeptidase, partial [Gemmataceae bacterium]
MKRWAFILCVAFAGSASAHAQSPPAWLPRYDLDLRVDPAARAITASMLVTWTNTGPATRTIVFNAHARYAIPDADIGLLAKTVEVLRLAPSESLSFDPPALDVSAAVLVSTHTRAGAEHKADPKTASLAYHYPDENPTSLVVQLPEPIESGGQVRLRLDFSYKLAPKKGRWGQWDGVTVLAQGLPTVAVYDNDGFHPSPFIPWHQPFYNEAGVYKVRLTLPAEQKLACSAAVARTVPAADGWVTHECVPACLRDFSFMCCARYEEHCAKVDGVDVRVLALPEHAHYGKEMVRFISEALPAYNRWFGRYPYPQFTVAEAYFGWNGNECGGLVMIDTRMMGMPTIAGAYVDYLISHELCHQWWYNVVGTNGYAETWMDEGLATYFSHRLTDEKRGKENKLLSYPPGLEWLPNIRREDFRNYGYLSVWKRGEGMPTVQDMPAYGHLMNLSAMTYDRGSKVVGLIEQRLGPDNMLDFMRLVFRKYQYRILRVADFQKELESFTGESWHDFFQHWVWGAGQCDWRVERVDVDADCRPFQSLLHRKKRGQEPTRVVIHLKQDKGFNENTVLGIRLKKDDGYAIRIPILPNVPFLDLPEQCARVYCKTSLPSPLGGEGLGVRGVKDDCHQTATVLVDITLPCPPQQISV